MMEWWGGPSQPVSFVLTTATFAFLFLERTERSGPPSSFMLPWSFASLQRHGVTEVGLPKNLRPPLPHRYSPFPSRSSEATHLSFLSLGMAQCLGSELRPGREHQTGIVVSTARRRDPSPPVRPGHPSPLPRGRRRREPPGPGGRPGKWPMGPGGLSPAGAAGSLRSRVRT